MIQYIDGAYYLANFFLGQPRLTFLQFGASLAHRNGNIPRAQSVQCGLPRAAVRRYFSLRIS